jgi:hypothetical protein
MVPSTLKVCKSFSSLSNAIPTKELLLITNCSVFFSLSQITIQELNDKYNK